MVQRCTVHKHRNLLAHAPERLHDEVTADYTDMIYAATPRKSRPAAKRSSASGGYATAPSPTVWRKLAIACSPSRACRRANGEAREQRTRSNVYTKSSSAGSKRRPCCHRQIRRRCCSGRCSPPVRSTCARSMAGRRLQQSPSISQLTSLPDRVLSKCRRSRHTEFQHKSRRHLAPPQGDFPLTVLLHRRGYRQWTVTHQIVA